MQNGRSAAWVLTIVLVAAFVWGLEQVALAPLETGEVYPPYSTLRSDPQGARALYESLLAQPDVTVQRLYRPRTMLAATDIILTLGVDARAWSSEKDRTLDDYEKLTKDGGRMVVGFLPLKAPLVFSARPVAEKRWNIKLASRRGGDRAVLYLEPGPEWTKLAEHDGFVTAAERGLGAGTVVLVADSYPLSNEGLREARDAGFITRVVGPARRIVFDENHFGVSETGSVTTLMRRYHLQGAVVVLVVVAGLFLWRSASSFLPPREKLPSGTVAGRDSLDGMSALLRRAVPEKQLLEACVKEWTKSARGKTPPPVENTDPVQAYRAACQFLEKR